MGLVSCAARIIPGTRAARMAAATAAWCTGRPGLYWTDQSRRRRISSTAQATPARREKRPRENAKGFAMLREAAVRLKGVSLPEKRSERARSRPWGAMENERAASPETKRTSRE